MKTCDKNTIPAPGDAITRDDGALPLTLTLSPMGEGIYRQQDLWCRRAGVEDLTRLRRE